MGLAYAIISIFFTVFYPRLLTRVICFGERRDKLYVKSKKVYYLIYGFWTLVFGTLCLMMGSSVGVNHTFDRILDFYGLYFEDYDYFFAESIYDKKDYKYQGDFTLDDMQVVYESGFDFSIYEKGERLAKVTVENKGLLKKVSYHWSREKLERKIAKQALPRSVENTCHL